MSNKDLPMMPFFPQDFLTATQLWKFPARGAYALLLMYEWILDELPNDTEQLARLVGMEFHEFEAVWATISKKFEENERGALFNQRLAEHRAAATARKEAKRAGAGLTNQKRWGGRSLSDRSPISKRVAIESPKVREQRVAIESPPSPSPSPSPTEEPKPVLGDKSPDTKTSKVKKTRKPLEEPEEFLSFKLAYPERSGDYRWRQALNSIHARLEEGHTWAEIIEGAHRYAAYCTSTGKIGTEYVMQASRFVGPDKSFQLPWRPTSGPPSSPSASNRPKSFDEWHAEQKKRAEGAP